ncbi:MAG: hypothetical protein JO161_11235, partial [Planctomycetaceae bacterium]|nr:hypothetical protein [Planctomycetaceae bacterium]
MLKGRQARFWIAGTLGAAAVLLIYFGFANWPATVAKVPLEHAAALGELKSVAALNQALREGDPQALGIFQQRVVPVQAARRHALSDDEAAGWIETLSCLRSGFFKYSPPARATAATVAGAILEKFTPEPAPARWVEALAPVHDIFSA